MKYTRITDDIASKRNFSRDILTLYLQRDHNCVKNIDHKKFVSRYNTILQHYEKSTLHECCNDYKELAVFILAKHPEFVPGFFKSLSIKYSNEKITATCGSSSLELHIFTHFPSEEKCFRGKLTINGKITLCISRNLPKHYKIGTFEDNCFTGYVETHYHNGDLYKGEIKDNHLKRGKTYYHNGSIYDGSWSRDTNGNDVQHGYGKFKRSSGQMYAGEWEFGKWHGTGTHTFSAGSHKGIFQDGFFKPGLEKITGDV
ncbi:MAG: hypothetical protein HRT90_01965 [Candidatus Margulisbacteria bacterium]|nr:hypothetical protein [Candidatus Margulisiibacteriota bacterium]